MVLQRFLGSIPHYSRLQNPRYFALLFLDEFPRLFIGNLLVGHTQRFPAVTDQALCEFEMVQCRETLTEIIMY